MGRTGNFRRLTKPISKPTSHRTHCVTIRGGATDGGNEQHPIHDEDQKDATSRDYEREIDRLDGAVRPR
jgi:hypothetical protein